VCLGNIGAGIYCVLYCSLYLNVLLLFAGVRTAVTGWKINFSK